eukprot:25580-Prymnesium_polylepis.1
MRSGGAPPVTRKIGHVTVCGTLKMANPLPSIVTSLGSVEASNESSPGLSNAPPDVLWLYMPFANERRTINPAEECISASPWRSVWQAVCVGQCCSNGMGAIKMVNPGGGGEGGGGEGGGGEGGGGTGGGGEGGGVLGGANGGGGEGGGCAGGDDGGGRPGGGGCSGGYGEGGGGDGGGGEGGGRGGGRSGGGGEGGGGSSGGGSGGGVEGGAYG